MSANTKTSSHTDELAGLVEQYKLAAELKAKLTGQIDVALQQAVDAGAPHEEVSEIVNAGNVDLA